MGTTRFFVATLLLGVALCRSVQAQVSVIHATAVAVISDQEGDF